MISRRRLLGAGAASAGGLLLGACDRIVANPTIAATMRSAERLTYTAQRLVTARDALAPEYGRGDLSPVFRSNGTAMPAGADYAALAADRFAGWRLQVRGAVRRPIALSLAEIGAMPRRTQITRHDCVEGWSAIGEWTGVPLAMVLARAGGLTADARYIVFHCADRYGALPYYESIDLVDAFHPQTILAWGLNRQLLPIPNGAPLRLRVERQLGYKHAKYVMAVEAVASLATVYGGKGGTWEDTNDYEWYAGI